MSYNRKTSSGSYMQRRRHPTVNSHLTQAITPDVVLDLDDLAKRAKEAGKAGKWIPPVFDYCPTCKQKQKEEEKQQQPPSPDEEPPKTVDIEEQGAEDSGPPQPQKTPGQQQQQNQKEEKEDTEETEDKEKDDNQTDTEDNEKEESEEEKSEEESKEKETESTDEESTEDESNKGGLNKEGNEEETEEEESPENQEKEAGEEAEPKETKENETEEEPSAGKDEEAEEEEKEETEEEEEKETEQKPKGSPGKDKEETEEAESEEGEEGQEDEESEEGEPGAEEPEEPEESLEEEPPPVTQEDVDAAKKGASNVASEFDQANRVTPDLETSDFEPVVAAADPQLYRDQKFISDMNTALKDWRSGFKTTTGATGSKFKVKEYIKSKGEEPFVTRIQKNAKGRKILVIGDFSGSVAPFEDDYKKAIVSSMEVLDGIGSKTAFFAFGGQTGEEALVKIGSGSYNNGRASFFKVKKFEEPRWLQVHSAKTSALINAGSTPTAETYNRLKSYIKRHRPDITLTLTDGGPDDRAGTIAAISELKHHTKMVAFGIGNDLRSSERITELLKGFGYAKVFGVSSVKDIPRKLVGMIAPT